jgi:hypothetical protein
VTFGSVGCVVRCLTATSLTLLVVRGPQAVCRRSSIVRYGPLEAVAEHKRIPRVRSCTTRASGASTPVLFGRSRVHAPHRRHRGQTCLYATTTGFFMLAHFVAFCNPYPLRVSWRVHPQHTPRRLYHGCWPSPGARCGPGAPRVGIPPDHRFACIAPPICFLASLLTPSTTRTHDTLVVFPPPSRWSPSWRSTALWRHPPRCSRPWWLDDLCGGRGVRPSGMSAAPVAIMARVGWGV